MVESVISSTITNQVTLGYGVTLSPLTITNTGDIDYGGGYAVLVATSYDGTLINNGTITGRTDGIYAPQYAVTIFNHGTIHGDQAGIVLNSFLGGANTLVNTGTISGNAGVAGSTVALTNSGLIDAAGFGIQLNFSTIVNSGTIIGQTGVNAREDVLSNTGTIAGSRTGLYLGGGTAVNSGQISGALGVQITDLAGPGSLTNLGSISGGVMVAGGVLDNAGHIAGGTGVLLGISGTAANSGYIYGQSYGVVIAGPPNAGGHLVNTGSIYSPNEAVSISAGYFNNSSGIEGGEIGVAVSGGLAVNDGQISSDTLAAAVASGSLVNSGTLLGGTYGVSISAGLVTNQGSIYGGSAGAFLSAGSLNNSGRISGAVYGVSDSFGTVFNSGFISSASDGVLVESGVITNAGTIAGGAYAVYGSFMTLGVDPGAVFQGSVENKNGLGLLDFTGAGVGKLDGIGTQIRGFGEIEFDSGASWTISGNAGGFNAVPIIGMTGADTIVLDSFKAVSSSFVSGAGLELSNGVSKVTLGVSASLASDLQVHAVGANTVITDVTCFAAGTRIATPDGDIAVEQLRIGDLVRTLHAGDQLVKWIGWRRYDGASIAGNPAALPVCIRKDAIADGVPARDLWVSPGHAIAIDGVLLHAGRLVNGVSVIQARQVDSVTYYHVELACHEILLAENCPAESFHDEHFRRQFVNAAEFRRLYPGEAAPGAMLKRLDSGFQLHAIARRVAIRAGIAEISDTGALRGYVDQTGPERCFGWAQDMAAPERPVSLDILSNGRPIGRVLANLYRDDVRQAGYGSGYQGFEFLLPADFRGTLEVRRSADAALLTIAETAARWAA